MNKEKKTQTNKKHRLLKVVVTGGGVGGGMGGTGEGGSEWCDGHWGMYRNVQPLYCTPETNNTVC